MRFLFAPILVLGACTTLRTPEVTPDSYLLHVPESAGTDAPLVVALHRLTEDGASMMRRSRLNEGGMGRKGAFRSRTSVARSWFRGGADKE